MNVFNILFFRKIRLTYILTPLAFLFYVVSLKALLERTFFDAFDTSGLSVHQKYMNQIDKCRGWLKMMNLDVY